MSFCHYGIEGNEIADTLSKMGANKIQEENTCTIRDVKSLIKAERKQTWLHAHPEYNKRDPIRDLHRNEQVSIFIYVVDTIDSDNTCTECLKLEKQTCVRVERRGKMLLISYRPVQDTKMKEKPPGPRALHWMSNCTGPYRNSGRPRL